LPPSWVVSRMASGKSCLSLAFLVVTVAWFSVNLLGCGNEETPKPTDTTTGSSSTTTTTTSCLCIFDVDRTLTGKQGDVGAKCPHNVVQNGVTDSAYGGGTLTLSHFALNVNKSECAACYLGTISAGDASGPNSPERKVLHGHLAVKPGKLPSDQWSGPHPVTSPLVFSCPDRTKQTAVPGVLAWYKKQGIVVNDENVHFFDDRGDNVEAFQGTKYNAKQISCGSRDLGGVVGYCGAALGEVVLTKGVTKCDGVLVA